jgi:hypothetical protein
MSSEIDPSVIRDDVKVAKSDVREQLQIAADEMTALQLITSTPRRMAYDDVSFDNL